MGLAGMSPATAKSYLRAIRDLSLHFDLPPDELSVDQIIDHLHFYKEQKKIGSSTLNTRICGIRFYYREVLQRNDMEFYIPNPRRATKPLAEVIPRREIKIILDCCGRNEKHRAIFMLLYSSGMRLSEICNLKTSHIDRDNMQICIHKGKGNKDRFTVLSNVALCQLELYFRQAKPQNGWLFNGQRKGEPMHPRSVQHALIAILKRTKISRHINIHTFRHSFAVHFLESGGHLMQLQLLLGHKHLTATLHYLNHCNLKFDGPISPLDTWWDQ